MGWKRIPICFDIYSWSRVNLCKPKWIMWIISAMTHLLSKIGYTISASNLLITFLCTTSSITAFYMNCGCKLNLLPSSMNIFCIHKSGLIPCLSAICGSSAFFLFFITFRKASTCSSDKVVERIKGNMSLVLKNMYLIWEGRSLNSNFSASSIYGLVGGPKILNGSTILRNILKFETSSIRASSWL